MAGSEQIENDAPGRLIRAELPAGLTAARDARTAVRRALAAWGIADPDRDAELLASELAANAAEHGTGPISLALHRHAEPDGQAGITCEITDTSPARPRPPTAAPQDERGRGLAIVAALATASGVRDEPHGKTSWFTLGLHDRIERTATRTEPEAEAGA
ncbi:MAG: ATP-binding protein [Streptosporangiaceae bacterium]|jgi:anti-sigma regulatory factor (Ser/Thr protein kinase)